MLAIGAVNKNVEISLKDIGIYERWQWRLCRYVIQSRFSGVPLLCYYSTINWSKIFREEDIQEWFSSSYEYLETSYKEVPQRRRYICFLLTHGEEVSFTYLWWPIFTESVLIFEMLCTMEEFNFLGLWYKLEFSPYFLNEYVDSITLRVKDEGICEVEYISL